MSKLLLDVLVSSVLFPLALATWAAGAILRGAMGLGSRSGLESSSGMSTSSMTTTESTMKPEPALLAYSGFSKETRQALLEGIDLGNTVPNHGDSKWTST